MTGSMSLTAYFERLGAPLKNSRWSWGAIRESDGAIFLRVWQDRKTRLDGKTYMMVTHHDAYVGNESSPGYRERLQQVEFARAGRPVYMIMCLVDVPDARPRKIKSFNKDDVFVGGQLIEYDGNTWVELVDRVDSRSIRLVD